MSHYVTPFLVLNLGSEMVYVVAQRLQAQNVSGDKMMRVLDEIIGTLVSRELITDIMKPQATYSHMSIKEMISVITQCSAMRLDPSSMNKLWDLITMVYKWQLTMSHEVIKITLRHLYEIENYITNPETQIRLQKVQDHMDNFNKMLSQEEKITLREDILYWLKQYNVRVSLLMRMGLQSMSGNFIVDNLNPVANDMLKNLGENIYAVTQNGKILEDRKMSSRSDSDVNEMLYFVDQINVRKSSSGNFQKGEHFLKLSINEQNMGPVEERKRLSSFGSIEVQVDSPNLEELVKDLSVKEDGRLRKSSLKEDLLSLLGAGGSKD
ncbi:protein OSCP1 isoform X1 [Harmonia axyridis]|uniref:protein OSCP1 isoform X1 n=2 Tax=Harmonia axyridis TaxID=115357 RepID=UPI001E276C36|nr:protein OSCP1 isoform X1 [Harmonia axyridis]XP_045476929.1 protein OSCP1 isoform X1 [Harmonia axyridis]